MKIKLDDQGQDFVTLDVDEDGVIHGYSPIFSGDRLRLIGIGSLDGEPYYTRREVFDSPSEDYSGLFVYMCNNFLDKEPLPWEADTLKYRVESVDL